jgi:hypothetical protein
MDTQQDFSSLSGSGSLCSADIPNLADHPALVVAPARRSRSPISVKEPATAFADGKYEDDEQHQFKSECQQQNLVREEVVAFLTAWEESAAQRRASAQSSGALSSMDVNEEAFLRVPANAGPPKLFYRTFWKSLTRRLVQRVEAAYKMSASSRT